MTPTKESIIASIESARHELEKTIEDIGKLPSLDPASVRFTANALNNFLTVSTGCIALLRQRLSAHSDPEVQNWLEGLQHATALMTGAAHGLMTTSISPGMQLRREIVDVTTLTARTCDFYQRLADNKGIQIDFTSDAPHDEALTDRVAIAAVLDNLLSNAVKFSAHGGRIWVRVTKESPHLVCSVRDEGPGIAPEEKDLLFTRGAQLSSRPTGGELSTGYGLAVAKELLDQLDGRIWCESESGRGSTFSFRIPASQA